jgi:hypothetical protein
MRAGKGVVELRRDELDRLGLRGEAADYERGQHERQGDAWSEHGEC